MGSNSLYYYYHTMAKTLDVYGQKIVTDKNGKSHDWAQDLLRAPDRGAASGRLLVQYQCPPLGEPARSRHQL